VRPDWDAVVVLVVLTPLLALWGGSWWSSLGGPVSALALWTLRVREALPEQGSQAVPGKAAAVHAATRTDVADRND
jgi:hypothetical protein